MRWRAAITANAMEPAAGPEAGLELDAEEAESGPLRRCIVTRARLEKPQMIRFVLGPEGEIVPDLAATLPGRGLWLSASRDVLETARLRGAFGRAARASVRVPPDLLALVRLGLARRIGETLGLARRAGQAVAGFQKAGEWLRAGRAALLVQASDGSAEECRRFAALPAMPVVAPLPAGVLGPLFGREHVVHVALAKGRLAERVQIDAARLAGLADEILADEIVKTPSDAVGRDRLGKTGE
jgi:predicted RNA-binding protein YlxR (DUF448 family)/ribosomal protein L30E